MGSLYTILTQPQDALNRASFNRIADFLGEYFSGEWTPLLDKGKPMPLVTHYDMPSTKPSWMIEIAVPSITNAVKKASSTIDRNDIIPATTREFLRRKKP
jgi:hypothetical protein